MASIQPASSSPVHTVGHAPAGPEVSVVIPCLNEADTIEQCIVWALEGLREGGLFGELIIADNGSTDGSLAIAARYDVVVVNVPAKGYGHALMAGIQAARGRYIIMGDADASYDFREIPRFVAALRDGHELVQGCRLAAGGGRIMPGAMPLSHRLVGNPLFSRLARIMFASRFNDIYCGLRGFTKELYLRLDQQCTGMEFAVEMIVKTSIRQAKVCEIPIVLHKDGRIAHARHLRTFRDGWRTLRFLLLSSPKWLFLLPGLASFSLGLIAYGLALPGVAINGAVLDAHTLLFGSVALICGFQSVVFSIIIKTYSVTTQFAKQSPSLDRLFRWMNLERGLSLSIVVLALGAALLVKAIAGWVAVDFGPLDYPHTLRLVVPGMTLIVLATQAALAGLFVSMMGMQRR